MFIYFSRIPPLPATRPPLPSLPTPPHLPQKHLTRSCKAVLQATGEARAKLQFLTKPPGSFLAPSKAQNWMPSSLPLQPLASGPEIRSKCKAPARSWLLTNRGACKHGSKPTSTSQGNQPELTFWGDFEVLRKPVLQCALVVGLPFNGKGITLRMPQDATRMNQV